MLACNVSQRARRAAIAADIAEAAAAVDALGTGNVIFATLIDDPANVRDRVDAYLGEIMLETANAAATVNAGLAYAAAVAEAVTATDAFSASVPGVFAAGVVEAASAGSAQDATVGAAPIKSRMLLNVMINSAVPRQANVGGTMVNL
jgi:hypothetical protein